MYEVNATYIEVTRYGTQGDHEHKGTNYHPNGLASSTSPQYKSSYTSMVVNLCPGILNKKGLHNR